MVGGERKEHIKMYVIESRDVVCVASEAPGGGRVLVGATNGPLIDLAHRGPGKL